MEADAMGAMTDALIGDRPNTYCLTKALGEKYLFEHAMDLPVGIFRPSIIAASWMEPEPVEWMYLEGVKLLPIFAVSPFL